jgi:hypothetical protein
MSTQAETAAWMGYETIDEMNAEHDPIHRALCGWLGLPSNSMRAAVGETLQGEDAALAAYEEDAVLHVQRFQQMARRAGLRGGTPWQRS